MEKTLSYSQAIARASNLIDRGYLNGFQLSSMIAVLFGNTTKEDVLDDIVEYRSKVSTQ